MRRAGRGRGERPRGGRAGRARGDQADHARRRAAAAAAPTGGAGPAAEVHLVGGAAGPLGGDRLRLRIEVRDGGWLRLRSAAASVALPSVPAAASTCGSARPSVPRPAGLAAGAPVAAPAVTTSGVRRWTSKPVAVSSGGTRNRSMAGTARNRATFGPHHRAVRRPAPATTTRSPLRPAHRGPARRCGAGGARALGQLLALDLRAVEPAGPVGAAPNAAVLPLAGGGTAAGATGRDLREVRTHLDPLVAAATVEAARIGAAAPASNRRSRHHSGPDFRSH